LPLIAVDWSDEEEDLEGHGTAQFDDVTRRWVVEFDECGVRYVPAGDRALVTTFSCVHCHGDLSAAIGFPDLPAASASPAIITPPAERRNLLRVQCPNCGRPIGEPLFPPPRGSNHDAQ
jgi:hypothetical protein